MASNHKLSGILLGRTITATKHQDRKLLIQFTDGSVMTVKTAGSVNTASTGGTVAAVRQAGTELHLDLDDGSTWTVETAEATSCVMVRDKNHVLEYAD
jgi:hypothetical protein